MKHVPSDTCTSQVYCSEPKVIYTFLLLLRDLDIIMAPHTCNCIVTWCTTITFNLLDERQSGCLHLFNICHEKVWQAPRQGGDISWTTISSSNWGWGIQLLSSLLRSIHKHKIQYMWKEIVPILQSSSLSSNHISVLSCSVWQLSYRGPSRCSVGTIATHISQCGPPMWVSVYTKYTGTGTDPVAFRIGQ